MPSGISIIICTKNRSSDLKITLDSVFFQRLLPDCLVIVDDGNAEDTRAILKKFDSLPEVRVIYVHPEKESSGLPAARNRGIRALPDLTGIILFLDDDVTLDEAYLEAIQDLFQKNPNLCGAGGFIRNVYHNRSLPVKVMLLITGFILPNLVPVSLFGPRITRTAEALYPLFRKIRADAVPAQWLNGCNMAYRSTVFSEGFTFDEHLIRYAQGEDLLFSHGLYQKGKKFLLSYNACLVHHISTESRISPLLKFVMTFGYRKYAIQKFSGNGMLGSLYYKWFVVNYFISAFILSLIRKNNFYYMKNTIKAYQIIKPFEKKIEMNDLESLNTLFSDPKTD